MFTYATHRSLVKTLTSPQQHAPPSILGPGRVVEVESPQGLAYGLSRHLKAPLVASGANCLSGAKIT